MPACESLQVLDVQSNSFRTEGRKALAAAFQANPRVAQAMPLSWHAGQESARSRLAQPPRSLVSVDTAVAAAAVPARKTDASLQRKKPANITPYVALQEHEHKDFAAFMSIFIRIRKQKINLE